MGTKCDVVGWLLVDDTAGVLVREENGRISLQTVVSENTFAHHSIQTGSFRRGNPILDPVTHETVGYEMERLASPFTIPA